MKKVTKILAPTDLSELSKAGVRYAMEMAGFKGAAEVIVYHVIGLDESPPYFVYSGAYNDEFSPATEFRPVSELIEERRRLLAKFLRENFVDSISKVRIRQEIEVGVPYKKIVEKAVEEGVEMIVMCTHGRTGFMHMLIGSVTEKVVRHATCPVLSVPPPKEGKLAKTAA